MSGKRIILDSNIVIALFAEETSVLDKLSAYHVLIPSIVLGELYYGSYKSDKKQENIERLDEFGVAADILEVDKQTSKHYGEIKSILSRNGTPIPENDVWIAALAKQYQVPVATRDKHFQRLVGISNSQVVSREFSQPSRPLTVNRLPVHL